MKHGLLWAGVSWLALVCPAARADGLAELRATLTRLTAESPLKAAVEVKTWRRLGDGKDAEVRQGEAAFVFEENARGLQVLYGKDVLARASVERRAYAKDKKAQTPVLDGLREMTATDMQEMANAAAGLLRAIDEAAFKGETADTYNGKPARRLGFELSIDTLAERDRKYIKHFDTELQVWIAPDGTPLGSRLRSDLSGRAFVVVGFEQHAHDERSYAVVGDRLVTLRRDDQGRASGAGERQEHRITKSLQVQP